MRRVVEKTSSRFEMMTFVKPDEDDPETYGGDVCVTILLEPAHDDVRARHRLIA